MELFVPGKLFLAGEYAVLEEGQPCVVLPVSRGIHVTLESSMKNHLTTDLFPGKSFSWHYNPSKNALEGDVAGMPFIRSAIEVITRYTLIIKGFAPPVSIALTSDMYDEGTGKKLGIGSSSAVTVAVIEGLCHYYGMDISKEVLFKLAYSAHYMEQKSGSGADIAASVYKQCVRYIAPQPSFIRENVHKLNDEEEFSHYMNRKWPIFCIETTQWKAPLTIKIVWTGEVRKTHGMIQKYCESKSNYSAEQNTFLRESRKSVRLLWQGLTTNSQADLLAGVEQSYQAIRKMTSLYEIPYMNEALEQFIMDIPKGSCGKPSGAGGGDCGIALVPEGSYDQERSALDYIVQQWREHHIYPLAIEIYKV